MNIDDELYKRLSYLGIIPDEIRSHNVGKSDYSKHTIQPWSIWVDYNMDPWDADIIKRVCRTKEESGMSWKEARIMDYEKIIHDCQEKLRQLKFNPIDTEINSLDVQDLDVPTQEIIISTELSAKGSQIYENFKRNHSYCGKDPIVDITKDISSIMCPVCKAKQILTDDCIKEEIHLNEQSFKNYRNIMKIN